MGLTIAAAGFILGAGGSAAAFTTDMQEDICAQPGVIFCENFEDRTVATSSPGIDDLSRPKFKNSGWALSQKSGMGVTTAQALDGGKSFVFNYAAISNPWPNVNAGGTGFMDSNFGSNIRDLYYRWYVRYSPGWITSPVSEKHLEIDYGFVAHIWSGLFGSYSPLFVAQLSATRVNNPQNIGSSPIIGDPQWHCLEAHVRMNSTLNGTDGLFEGWIDGTQRLMYPNINVSTQRTGQSVVVLSGYWNCLTNDNVTCTNDPANNHPAQFRYLDNIVISTQRVGCLGSPSPSDAQAPTVPAGLNAHVASSSQINLSWTASTDNIGVTGYRIYRGGSQIATAAGTSYSDTGLAASTAYTYTVAAYDAAGNVSSQSAAASATTPAGAPSGPSGLLVDFGSSAGANTFGVAGWNTAIKDVYTTYSSAGPGGTMSGFNGGYDYQGVTGTARTFSAGDEIVVTWYNGGTAAATFTPQISLTVAGRVGSGAGWYPMSPVTIPASGTATSRFTFSAATSGAYSLVNVNVNLDNGAMICDKIMLVSGSAAAVTCDANADGSTNVVDVQLSVNQALGASSCASDINQDGACNVVDVQRIVNAALGGACATGP